MTRYRPTAAVWKRQRSRTSKTCKLTRLNLSWEILTVYINFLTKYGIKCQILPSYNIYIFIHHQDGSAIDIKRLNKIYNLTKKQRMKQAVQTPIQCWGKGKVIRNPHPGPDHQEKLKRFFAVVGPVITLRLNEIGRLAYFAVILLTDRRTHTQTDRQTNSSFTYITSPTCWRR